MTAAVTAELSSSRTRPARVLAVASFGAFLAFLDATVVNVAFPDIRESFPSASVAELSWVLNAYNIVFASFLIVCGRLTDLLGRKRMFALGTVVFTTASVVCAVSGSLELLVGARVLQALGAALLVPASLAVVVEAFSEERRSHAIGLWGASAALAAGLGPPIGGALVELGGWRLAFLVNLPIGIVAWAAIRRVLVESRAPGRRRLPDVRGALLLAGCLTALTLGIVQGNDWGWTSVRVVGAFVVSLVLFVGFVVSSKAHPQPLLDPALLRIRPFVVSNVVTLLAGAGFFAYMLTNILWLQYVWQYSILEAGLALVPGALVAAVVAGSLSEAARTYGYRLVVVPGAVIWCAAYIWYATAVGTEPAFVSDWLPGQVLSGLGVGATLPILGSAAVAAVPGGRFATASAVVSSARQLGGAIGIAILVVIIGTPTALTTVDVLRDGWLFSAAVFGVAAVVALFLGRVGSDRDHEVADTHSVAVHVPGSPPSTDDGELLMPPATSPPTAFLDRLNADVREDLLATGEQIDLAAGEWLMRSGDPADSMYVVLSGRLEVVIGDVVVRELGAGDALGELAILTGGRRSASVRARRDASVVSISHAAFMQALEGSSHTAVAVATALAEQLATARPPEVDPGAAAVIAVVALSPGAPVHEVADVLHRGIAKHLDVVTVPRMATHELAKAESLHDRVLLVADGTDRDLLAWCVRQSDRVVLVARPDDPVPESWTGGGPAHPDLVLVGPRPADSTMAAWAEAIEPWHITTTTEQLELGSLVAALAGRSLGLVLAGGGARAMAHIGVLRELEEAGIVVHRIAGTSLGAIVAATYALGHDAATVHDLHYEAFVRQNPFADYTVPMHALTKGQRTPQLLRRFLGDETRIEATPRLFRCVSVDLGGRELAVHRSGLLWEATAASARLPILTPPLEVGGRLLVDGCVLDNLPVGTLLERDEGPLVAVNIGSDGSGRSQGPPRVPALGDTLLRLMTIGGQGTAQRARDHGAYVITPPSLGVGMMEFHQLDRMVEAGRIAARALLDATGGDLLAAPRRD